MNRAIAISTPIVLLVMSSSAVASTFVTSGTSFNFGNVGVGANLEHEVIFTNVSGTTQVFNGTGGASSGFGGTQNCQGRTLAPGASCSFFYKFNPTTIGNFSGTTSGTANGQAFSFDFRGTGIESFKVTPIGLDFGDVAVGASRQQNVTVTNVSKSNQTINGTGGATQDFGGSQNCQGRTLAPGQSCSFFYQLNPTADGTFNNTTNVTINGQPETLTFRGTSGKPDGVFLASGTNFDFGNVAVGQTTTQEISLTNISSSAQLFSGTGGASSTFGGTQNCEGRTIAPGASCSYFYQFTPSALGEVTGAATGTANGDPFSFNFRGKGILPYLVDIDAFDFGDVVVGASSMQLETRIYNESDVSRVFSFTGGASSLFGGVQNCVGQLLAPGAYCSFFYKFTPTNTGEVRSTTSFTVDGFNNVISFRGVGTNVDGSIDPPGGAIPEPSAWLMMLAGFGAVGSSIRIAAARNKYVAILPRRLA